MIEFATLQQDDVISNLEVITNKAGESFPIGTSFVVVMAREEWVRVTDPTRSTLPGQIVTFYPSLQPKLKYVERHKASGGTPYKEFW